MHTHEYRCPLVFYGNSLGAPASRSAAARNDGCAPSVRQHVRSRRVLAGSAKAHALRKYSKGLGPSGFLFRVYSRRRIRGNVDRRGACSARVRSLRYSQGTHRPTCSGAQPPWPVGLGPHGLERGAGRALAWPVTAVPVVLGEYLRRYPSYSAQRRTDAPSHSGTRTVLTRYSHGTHMVLARYSQGTWVSAGTGGGVVR